MKKQGRAIIVSPLNWGLGHASRCVPIVRALKESGFDVILAGDGGALALLSSEFADLRSYELPSYDIRYSGSSKGFQLNLLLQGPKVLKAMNREQQAIGKILEKERVAGIISDNRFGVRSPDIPSVYLTHQLTVKAGWMTPMATYWHRRLISKFDRCWVCDHAGPHSLAGELSSDAGNLDTVSWIGPLSRFSSEGPAVIKDVDIAVVLSGPEPSRSLFEQQVREELMGTDYRVVLVRGLIGDSSEERTERNFTICDFLLAKELESLIRRSHLVVCRSGYSSIMDLAAIGARALLVPTPGQAEQKYLGRFHAKSGLCHVASQESFGLDAIIKALEYPGFETKKTSKNEWDHSLFDVFRQ